MRLKKSLENNVRGWLPKEPTVSKTSTRIDSKTRIENAKRKQDSPIFKTRTWLHGASAFISSLMGQISLKTKILVLVFGLGIFTTLLLYYLTINDFIGDFVLFWTGKIVPNAFLILIIATYSYDYFKKRAYRKNHPGQNISPILRLCGTIIGVIGGAILAISYFLTLIEYSFTDLSTIPFYLNLVGLLVFLLGWGLYIKWRKVNKLRPF